MAPRSYYSVLGIDRSASDDEIKSAYKKLALEWHPDKNQNREKEAKVRFQEISEAYQVLSDPRERKKYDSCYSKGSSRSGAYKSNRYSGQDIFSHHFENYLNDSDEDEFFSTPDFLNPFEIFDQVFRSQMAGIKSLFNMSPSFSNRPFLAFDDAFEQMQQNMRNMAADSFISSNPNSKAYIKRSTASYNSNDPQGLFMKSESRTYENGKWMTKKKTYMNGQETTTIEEDGRVVSQQIKDRPLYSKNRSIKG